MNKMQMYIKVQLVVVGSNSDHEEVVYEAVTERDDNIQNAKRNFDGVCESLNIEKYDFVDDGTPRVKL